MADVTLEDRFRGTCNLAILHLRRAAKSNDLEACFETARNLGMINADQETFIRACLDANDTMNDGAHPDLEITEERVKALQTCVLSLNTADPA